jgi:hypothetical protein
MMEDLWANLTYHVCMTIFFLGWPVVGAVVIQSWQKSKGGDHFCLCEALYYSLATYFGMDCRESNPPVTNWAKLIHRFVGLLAWAYITAVFITTIT